MGFSLWCRFSCIFSSARFAKFESYWVQLNGFFIVVLILHVSSVHQGLQISSHIEGNSHNGFFIIVPIFMYLQFSKVQDLRIMSHIECNWMVFHFNANFMYFQFNKICKCPVTLRATEWVFHFSANFHVFSVQQGLRISSHIEGNWMSFSL